MSRISLRKFLALMAIAGALGAGLGACQKDEMGSLPPAGQSGKSPSQSDRNSGDAGNMRQQPGQSGDMNQKNQ